MRSRAPGVLLRTEKYYPSICEVVPQIGMANVTSGNYISAVYDAIVTKLGTRVHHAYEPLCTKFRSSKSYSFCFIGEFAVNCVVIPSLTLS